MLQHAVTARREDMQVLCGADRLRRRWERAAERMPVTARPVCDLGEVVFPWWSQGDLGVSILAE